MKETICIICPNGGCIRIAMYVCSYIISIAITNKNCTCICI